MNNLAYSTAPDAAPASPQPVSLEELAQLQTMRPVPRISIQAFCETEGVVQPIERAGEDRRMAKAHLKTHLGGLATAVEFYQTAPTPNLIIIESRSEPREITTMLGRLAEHCDPSTKVVVIGHYNDVSLYRELIRSGVSEYIVAPISMADVISVISNIFIDPEAEPIGRSIAFIGAKGGVGSSTIAHNFAWSASSLFKLETVVADLDLAFGTANINFDQDPAQGIAEALFAPDRVDEVYLDRLLAQCAEKLSLLAAPSSLERTYDFGPDAFKTVIEIAQRSAPFLVLDMPHAWNGWTRSTLEAADEVVITATPELANLRNTKNLVDTLRKLRPNDPPPRLIINQMGVPKRPEITVKDFSEPLDIEPVAVIPFDPQLFGNAANNGRMIGEMDAAHAVAAKINEITHILAGRAEVKTKKKPALAALLQRFKPAKKG